ncbi:MULTISPECIES: hypothetical protein [Microbacterium]|uniref:hypothetical protein n=1 Tax=Microbacterium TaxID=33882 RepID=UPI0011EAB0E2|nr:MULTISPECIES: hypothetical protein [Microbacterium]
MPSVVLLGALALAGCAAEAPVTELDVSEIAADTTPFQAKILEDGMVSPAEYERALLSQRDCVVSAGGDAGEIVDIGNGEKGFEYSVTASTEQERLKLEAATEACARDYIEDIGLVWGFQNLPSQEDLDDMRPQVAACLRGVGIEVDDDFTRDTLKEEVGASEAKYEAMRPCAEEFKEFFAGNPAERDETSHVEEDGGS